MIIDLVHALHEDECPIGRAPVLALLRDDPPILRSVVDGAVVSRDCLQLDLDVPPDRPPYGEMRLFVIMVDEYLILDHILVLITADPSGPCSQIGLIFQGVLSAGSEHKELVA